MADPQSHSPPVSAASGHGHDHDHGHAPGDPNAINLKKIIVIGVVSLAIFALGILWAYRLKVDRVEELRGSAGPHVPAEVGKAEIGIVDQVPFDIDRRLGIWRAEHQRKLNSYGWIDRGKGIAHIPIEAAMDRVVAAPPDIPGQGVPPAAAPVVVPSPEPPKTTAAKTKSDRRQEERAQ